MIKFTLWDNDDCCKRWMVYHPGHGDFSYWLVLTLTYTEEYQDVKEKYWVELGIVAPAEPPAEELSRALDSMGIDRGMLDEAYKNNPNDVPALIAKAIAEYGVRAVLWHGEGNNANKLLKQARYEVKLADFLFGFYMDRYQNRIGATGWDVVKGNLWPRKQENESENAARTG